MAIIGGGVYYYKNIYKKKKDEQMDLVEALDKDDFVPEDYEEDEDADFDLDDDYQEKTMEMLMRDDEIKGETGSGEESSGEVSEDVDEDITANYTTSHKENKSIFQMKTMTNMMRIWMHQRRMRNEKYKFCRLITNKKYLGNGIGNNGAGRNYYIKCKMHKKETRK